VGGRQLGPEPVARRSFTVYGRSEGWPSVIPTTVLQDHAGRVWVGFHESGLMLASDGERRVYTARDGLPDNQIYSVRETRSGDLLIGTRNGLAVMHGGSFRVYRPADRIHRFNVYDALEDNAGRIWLATPAGWNGATAAGSQSFSPANRCPTGC